MFLSPSGERPGEGFATAESSGMIKSYHGEIMSKVAKRTFSLPTEQAAYIDEKVESGAYASSSEVIRAGLRALQERDLVLERWLLEEVVPTYDEMKAHPKRKISAKAAFAELRSRYTPRRKARR